MDVESEIKQLVIEIERLGTKGPDGRLCVKFLSLIDDERCGNVFEAIVGTLRAAKRKKIIDFEGEFLLKGVHDDVDVIVL